MKNMRESVERISYLMTHPVFKECIEKNRLAEVNRSFCHHDIEHLLTVSRMMYIKVLELELPFEKSLVYATGLLHDLGRFMEYEKKASHDEAGALLAERILPECGFDEEECHLIAGAIGCHRGDRDNILMGEAVCVKNEIPKHTEPVDLLSNILYLCDKSSRNCSFCPAKEECKWSEEKKRMHLNVI